MMQQITRSLLKKVCVKYEILPAYCRSEAVSDELEGEAAVYSMAKEEGPYHYMNTYFYLLKKISIKKDYSIYLFPKNTYGTVKFRATYVSGTRKPSNVDFRLAAHQTIPVYQFLFSKLSCTISDRMGGKAHK